MKFRTRGGDLTEEAVVALLAEDLLKLAQRVKQGRIFGRCECVTAKGYQCGGYAHAWKEGRKVCRAHVGAGAVNLVEASDPYAVFTELVRALSAHDPQFRAAIEKGLQ